MLVSKSLPSKRFTRALSKKSVGVSSSDPEAMIQPARAMKKLAKICFWTLAVLLIVIAIGINFTIGWRPFIGPKTRPLTQVKFENTPERLARGAYIVNNVASCMDCHSPHRWAEHDAPILPNMIAAGQDMTMLKGLPGQIVAPNISPDPETGAGNWTDDQLARAIREGIGHDGRALFPLMPYQAFSHMSDEDLASVIVYSALVAASPPAAADDANNFPVRYLIRGGPRASELPIPAPDVSTSSKRGTYLVEIAGCNDWSHSRKTR